MEPNSVQLNVEELDLNELVQHTLPSVELKVNERKGFLTIQVPDKPSMVMADKLHLTNILHNLIDNAVKYGKPNVVPIIDISVTNNNKGVTFQVKDNGVGIAREHQKRIFDKFYRVSTGNVHNVKGFGLGLFYVKEICKQHGWKIHLDSVPGRGTAISITMPSSSTR
jgi:two-component system, OmpR family, phosphate regulon sensor histidine kinase PhoR